MEKDQSQYQTVRIDDPENQRSISTCNRAIAERAKKGRPAHKIVFWILIIGLFGYMYFPWSNIPMGEPERAKVEHNNEWPTPPAHCEPLDTKRTLDFQFGELKKKRFEFVEVFTSSESEDAATAHARPRSFRGTITVLPAPDTQTEDARVVIQLNSSSVFLVEHTSIYQTCNTLRLELPSIWRQKPEHIGYMSVGVSIFVKPGITLEEFSVSAKASDVQIADGLDLTVTKTANFRLNAGNLMAVESFKSRKTYIDVDAGSISGQYGLYDVLSIRAKAGSITADVLPKPIWKDSPADAVFAAESHSGSVHVAFPPEGVEIPERDYYTTVSSHQGTIRGCFLHGRNTALSTQAGSIDVDILPYAADLYKSDLTITTAAGSQKVTVRSPHRDAGKAMKRLTSKHHTAVSSLKLKYPSQWEGKIEGKTKVSSLKLSGSDLRIIEEGRIGPIGHYVKAERGDGESLLEFVSNVGSANVVVG